MHNIPKILIYTSALSILSGQHLVSYSLAASSSGKKGILPHSSTLLELQSQYHKVLQQYLNSRREHRPKTPPPFFSNTKGSKIHRTGIKTEQGKKYTSSGIANPSSLYVLNTDSSKRNNITPFDLLSSKSNIVSKQGEKKDANSLQAINETVILKQNATKERQQQNNDNHNNDQDAHRYSEPSSDNRIHCIDKLLGSSPVSSLSSKSKIQDDTIQKAINRTTIPQSLTPIPQSRTTIPQSSPLTLIDTMIFQHDLLTPQSMSDAYQSASNSTNKIESKKTLQSYTYGSPVKFNEDLLHSNSTLLKAPESSKTFAANTEIITDDTKDNIIYLLYVSDIEGFDKSNVGKAFYQMYTSLTDFQASSDEAHTALSKIPKRSDKNYTWVPGKLVQPRYDLLTSIKKNLSYINILQKLEQNEWTIKLKDLDDKFNEINDNDKNVQNFTNAIKALQQNHYNTDYDLSAFIADPTSFIERKIKKSKEEINNLNSEKTNKEKNLKELKRLISEKIVEQKSKEHALNERLTAKQEFVLESKRLEFALDDHFTNATRQREAITELKQNIETQLSVIESEEAQLNETLAQQSKEVVDYYNKKKNLSSSQELDANYAEDTEKLVSSLVITSDKIQQSKTALEEKLTDISNALITLEVTTDKKLTDDNNNLIAIQSHIDTLSSEIIEYNVQIDDIKNQTNQHIELQKKTNVESLTALQELKGSEKTLSLLETVKEKYNSFVTYTKKLYEESNFNIKKIEAASEDIKSKTKVLEDKIAEFKNSNLKDAVKNLNKIFHDKLSAAFKKIKTAQKLPNLSSKESQKIYNGYPIIEFEYDEKKTSVEPKHDDIVSQNLSKLTVSTFKNDSPQFIKNLNRNIQRQKNKKRSLSEDKSGFKTNKLIDNNRDAKSEHKISDEPYFQDYEKSIPLDTNTNHTFNNSEIDTASNANTNTTTEYHPQLINHNFNHSESETISTQTKLAYFKDYIDNEAVEFSIENKQGTKFFGMIDMQQEATIFSYDKLKAFKKKCLEEITKMDDNIVSFNMPVANKQAVNTAFSGTIAHNTDTAPEKNAQYFVQHVDDCFGELSVTSNNEKQVFFDLNTTAVYSGEKKPYEIMEPPVLSIERKKDEVFSGRIKEQREKKGDKTYGINYNELEDFKEQWIEKREIKEDTFSIDRKQDTDFSGQINEVVIVPPVIHHIEMLQAAFGLIKAEQSEHFIQNVSSIEMPKAQPDREFSGTILDKELTKVDAAYGIHYNELKAFKEQWLEEREIKQETFFIEKKEGTEFSGQINNYKDLLDAPQINFVRKSNEVFSGQADDYNISVKLDTEEQKELVPPYIAPLENQAQQEEQQGGQKNDSVAEALGEDPLEDPLAAFYDYSNEASPASKKRVNTTQQKTGDKEQGDANQEQTVEAEATATNTNTAVEATATNANTAVEAATTTTEAESDTDIEDDSVAPQSEPKKQKPKPVKTQTVAPKSTLVKTQIVNAPTPAPVTPKVEPVTPTPQPADSFIEKQALKSAQSQIAIMALQRNNNNLDERMQLHASPAAASSDDAVNFELWTKGSFNSGSSKKDKVASFENVSYRDAAATIGLETKVNNVMLGVSYARSVGTMDFSLAPKNEAKLELPLNTISNIYSIYGSALIMPNLHFSSAANLGQISFALAPDVSGAQKTAAAKLMSNADNTTKLGLLDLEGKFTYDLTLGNDISLRPTVGLGYTRVHNKDLEGSEAQLYNHARVVLGAAMSKDFYSGEVVITPKIHAGGAIVLGDEDNANNTAQSKQQLDASQALNLGNFFNVGASTSVKSKNGASFELGVDYTVNKQYDNYSGYMKVTISF